MVRREGRRPHSRGRLSAASEASKWIRPWCAESRRQVAFGQSLARQPCGTPAAGAHSRHMRRPSSGVPELRRVGRPAACPRWSVARGRRFAGLTYPAGKSIFSDSFLARVKGRASKNCYGQVQSPHAGGEIRRFKESQARGARVEQAARSSSQAGQAAPQAGGGCAEPGAAGFGASRDVAPPVSACRAACGGGGAVGVGAGRGDAGSNAR